MLLNHKEADKPQWSRGVESNYCLGRAQSYGVLDDRNILLKVLCASGGVLDLLEDLPKRGLLANLTNERNGRFQVFLYYIPWHLVMPTPIHCLQLVACFLKVCGVLVDVFGAIVYLRPPRRHYFKLDAFERVN